MTNEEGFEKTKERYRKLLKQFGDRYRKIKSLEEYKTLTSEVSTVLGKMRVENPKAFWALNNSRMALLSLDGVTLSRLTGKATWRV